MTKHLGKRVIVTGGAMGLGRAVADLFASEGAQVTVADIDASAGAETVRSIVDSGGEAHFITCDVASADSVKGMVEIAAEEGIDILVNNAGILRAGSVVSTSEADWDQVINVNLRSVYLCSKYALPHIAKRTDGAVVNIASVAGLDGLRDSAAYNASKGGAVLLTKSMALDFAAQGVRVNCICPGVIRTKLSAALWEDDKAAKEFLARKALGRFGEVDELVGAAIYFASDASSFTTGAVLQVDGGMVI